jgi:hypothetical protein
MLTKGKEWLWLRPFLKRYHKAGDEFLSRIVGVTDDKTWASFVNIETKGQSKQWMHTHSPNKPKKFKQTLSNCQKADDNCFLGQERSADGGSHAARGHINARSVLWNTKTLRLIVLNKRRGMLTPGILFRMTMCVRIQLLALEHCWSISTCSERLPPVYTYLPGDLVGITAVQQ